MLKGRKRVVERSNREGGGVGEKEKEKGKGGGGEWLRIGH